MAELRWILGSDTLCTFNSSYYLKTNLGSIDDLLMVFNIYPNPSSAGQSFIQFQVNGHIEKVEMYSIDGREIETRLESNKLYYNSTAGSYVMRIKIDSNWYFRRIILN
jgi:hypothetical protein